MKCHKGSCLRPQTETDLRLILGMNPLTIHVLRAVQSLNLPDWAVGAGFVRNQIWDYIHDRPPTQSFTDIDVLFFDAADTDKEREERYEDQLHAMLPELEFEVRNQARMHEKKGEVPYKNTEDGIRHWTETATAVAVYLDGKGVTQFIAPHGLDDLCQCVLRPTFPHYAARALERAEQKGWKTRWPKLTFIGM